MGGDDDDDVVDDDDGLDGDLNTAQGQTVDPLPFHGMSSYPEGAVGGYPINDEYSSYREEYNTRVITTDRFKNSLKNTIK